MGLALLAGMLLARRRCYRAQRLVPVGSGAAESGGHRIAHDAFVPPLIPRPSLLSSIILIMPSQAVHAALGAVAELLGLYTLGPSRARTFFRGACGLPVTSPGCEPRWRSGGSFCFWVWERTCGGISCRSCLKNTLRRSPGIALSGSGMSSAESRSLTASESRSGERSERKN